MKGSKDLISAWIVTPPGKPTVHVTIAPLADLAVSLGWTYPSDFILEAHKVVAHLRSKGCAVDYAPLSDEDEEEIE